MKRFSSVPIHRLLSLALTGVLFFTSLSTARAQTPLRLGIISDSSSDEYRADDNRGNTNVCPNNPPNSSCASTTLSWDELLVKYRGFDIGPWGTRSEPRRSGFEYNWARSGAVAHDLVVSGAMTGLAQQISSGKVDIVYFSIGANDYAYYKDGAKIYDGTISGAALTQKNDAVVADIERILDTLIAASPTIKVVFVTVGDMGKIPVWQAKYPDASKRLRVTQAVDSVNARLLSYATGKPRVFIMDAAALMNELFGKVDSSGALIIGGEKIVMAPAGDEPHHAIVSDGIHAGTVLGGFQANIVVRYINQALGTHIAEFTEREMLSNAGIIVTPTPSPTPISEACRSDINKDTKVNLTDYNILVKNFLHSPLLDSRADLTGDGNVNLSDYNIFARNFLKSCP